MKILEVISDANIGGAGIQLLTRLLTNKTMCDKTTVVIPKNSMLKKRLSDDRIDFIEIDACSDRSFELSAIPKYIGLIKVISPDIVNCHGCLSFRIAAFLCGVPVRIYTRHCSFPLKWWQKNKAFKFFIGKAQMLLSNGIIAVAEAAKEDLVDMGISADRIRVIINGVKGIQTLSYSDREKIRSQMLIPQNAIVVSIFARLEEYKGHTDLINAAEILLKGSDNYRFLIVGCGNDEEKLKEQCKTKGLDRYFIFTGFAEDVTKYFNITDINVNCSHGTETSSLALSEGMSLGIPSVASNYGGNSYMVCDGINGYIYSAFDAKALAMSIERIATDKLLYEQLSKNAYLRYRRELNAEKMAEATYNYYTELRAH